MGSALLSRFDLVFILLDKPDEHLDSVLSEHVMALHANKRSAFTDYWCTVYFKSEAFGYKTRQHNSEKWFGHCSGPLGTYRVNLNFP